MAPLATETDITARLGRSLTPEESARVDALLDDASTLVRDHTRQDFDQTAGDQIVLRPVGTEIRLPQRPVTAVTAVDAVDCDGQPSVPLSGWCWDGRDIVDIATATAAATAEVPHWWWTNGPDTYQVTYDHGYATVPTTVVKVVCDMVLDTLLAPSMAPGMASEQIGSYNYRMQPGVSSSGSGVALTKRDEKNLRRYGPRRSGTIQVRAG